ncbi:MAG TPA: hypothetical protein DHW42_08200 [Candidatus Marinimicrobia bacterium]|nr:hypothetical protein [Candidatus Neomarinimicrobiota bacterium]
MEAASLLAFPSWGLGTSKVPGVGNERGIGGCVKDISHERNEQVMFNRQFHPQKFDMSIRYLMLVSMK